jgi:hypothetical protein
MGFRFRRRIKILPGIIINLSKKGLSSLSLGGRGATMNISKKGTKNTFGIPGTGFSYQTKTEPWTSPPKSGRSVPRSPAVMPNSTQQQEPREDQKGLAWRVGYVLGCLTLVAIVVVGIYSLTRPQEKPITYVPVNEIPKEQAAEETPAPPPVATPDAPTAVRRAELVKPPAPTAVPRAELVKPPAPTAAPRAELVKLPEKTHHRHSN